jgi:hypothetical protein
MRARSLLLLGLAALAVPFVLLACDSGGSACGDCEDGVPCTQDSCDAASGQCGHVPDSTRCGVGLRCDLTLGCVSTATCQTSADCDDRSDCTVDACEAGVGCTHTPLAACDDGNACTAGDSCASGTCVGEQIQCDDQNACTDDSCDTLAGCAHDPNQNSCDDGDACSLNDACQAGACAGTPRDCDDGNPCTDDGCAGGACTHAPNNATCDDANPCTTGEGCSGGQCSGGTNSCQCGSDAECDPYEDGNACNGTLACQQSHCEIVPHPGCDTSADPPCRRNTCVPATGACQLQPRSDGAGCDDGDACTRDDQCQAGACGGAPITCTDANPCTDASCDPDTGCVFSPNQAACQDGNACTQDDRCQQGECRGEAVVCQDADPCTDALCQPATGCTFPFNTAACDDQDACTQGDACAQGACRPGAERCCTDGQDNDGDGHADCQDEDCGADPACVVYQVGWCRLQWPLDLDELEGARVDVYGRLYILGVTTRTPGADADPRVQAALGYGPRDSDPAQAGWTWLSAAPNPAWLDDAEPGNDEYWATFTVPPAAGSPYDFAYRFSADAGASWTVCDRAAGAGHDGSEDGYQSASAGKLLSRVDAGPQVGWCRLQWPTGVNQAEGSQVTAYGRVYIQGITDLTPGTDLSAQVGAELGYGPDGSDPAQGGWVWLPAGPNPAWYDAAGGEPDNDEYQAELVVPRSAGSPYDFAFRFSANGGQTWTLCDTNAGAGMDGSQDGYAPAQAGALVSTASAADDSNWGFEESWAAGQPPPDMVVAGGLQAAPVASPVSRGAQAAGLGVTSPDGNALRVARPFPGPPAGQTLTFHAWVREADPAAAARPAVWLDGAPAPGALASEDGAAFVELVAAAEISGAPLPASVGGGLLIEPEAGWDGDASLLVDDFDLTLRQPFQAGDGALDAFADTLPAAPPALAASPEPLYAAINDQGTLYLAGARGIPGSTDKMIFAWLGGPDPSARAPFPWAKAGELAGPVAGGRLLALVEEPGAGVCGFWEWDGAGWQALTGATCAGGALLEGALELAGPGQAAALPASLALASAQFNTWDTGAMWSASQTPACLDCMDDDLSADETLSVHRAALLMGRLK